MRSKRIAALFLFGLALTTWAVLASEPPAAPGSHGPRFVPGRATRDQERDRASSVAGPEASDGLQSAVRR